MSSRSGFIDWEKVPPIHLGPGVRIRAPHGEKVMISLVEIDAGAVVPPHEHPHEQAGMVLEGRMELTISGECRVLSQGDAYIIPGGTTHSARSVAGPCRALDIFSPIREDYAQGLNRYVAGLPYRQGSASDVGSTPSPGKGGGGGAPPAKR